MYPFLNQTLREFYFADSLKNVGHNKTSMLQDIEYGKDIELDALLGSVIELGEIAKIQTPHLKSIYACCNLLQNKIKSTCGRLKIDI